MPSLFLTHQEKCNFRKINTVTIHERKEQSPAEASPEKKKKRISASVITKYPAQPDTCAAYGRKITNITLGWRDGILYRMVLQSTSPGHLKVSCGKLPSSPEKRKLRYTVYPYRDQLGSRTKTGRLMARRLKYHTITEHKREIAASAVVFYLRYVVRRWQDEEVSYCEVVFPELFQNKRRTIDSGAPIVTAPVCAAHFAHRGGAAYTTDNTVAARKRVASPLGLLNLTSCRDLVTVAEHTAVVFRPIVRVPVAHSPSIIPFPLHQALICHTSHFYVRGRFKGYFGLPVGRLTTREDPLCPARCYGELSSFPLRRKARSLPERTYRLLNIGRDAPGPSGGTSA
ncbi:hypothetical protein EVAR_96773_1 [Eumeta japonica]|uniref:Uncharacterized protein n=1 Tax=Eumeta variegata TaxID=151549 RepID=A0A4C1WQU4_EUMVA|nr:hypothetical protein EVAR_96773_1 [Eumeta japonica]